MALGIFLVSFLVAVGAATATAVGGGGWLAVICWGIGSAWLSSLMLTGALILKYSIQRSNRASQAPVLVPAGLSHRTY